MRHYKTRLLAEARGDVNHALDIALARIAALDACVSSGLLRTPSPAEYISKAVTYAEPEVREDATHTGETGEPDNRRDAG